MIKIIKSKSQELNDILTSLKQRSGEIDIKVENAVKDVIENVKSRGDEALFEYTEKFDGVKLHTIEIEKSELKKAFDKTDAELISALKKAAENIKAFHQKQKHEGFIDAKPNGVILGQRVRGLERVGVYVPGGTAAYPSSVLMNTIPAKIAGVKEVIMVTPPLKDGSANADILAAAYIAGVDRVFLVGGAQAIAALAYSTESIPKVDKIVGPGNIFVATAKKFVFGQVDIDMIAGPSEILIIADKTGDASYIAADLMGQAEHDVLASSILLTDDISLANEVKTELDKQIESLSRKDIIKKSIEDFGLIIVCDDINEAADLANEFAPEHLEVMTKKPFELLGKLDNAGSIFLGKYSPEALGDYFAGPNHVLPTSSTARFFSPLSVDSFVKKSSFIFYTKEALELAKDDIVTIADREMLTAHANSIKVRFQ